MPKINSKSFTQAWTDLADAFTAVGREIEPYIVKILDWWTDLMQRRREVQEELKKRDSNG